MKKKGFYFGSGETADCRFDYQADEDVRSSCCIQSASERQTEASSHHIFI